MKTFFVTNRKFLLLGFIALWGGIFAFGCKKDPETTIPSLTDNKAETKTVALTFDDGPDSLYTPMILDILAEKGVKATFFEIGERIQKFPGITKRAFSEGHLIGNHTFEHIWLPGRAPMKVIKDIDKTQQLIDSICGSPEKLFRPPWGAISQVQKDSVTQHGYVIVLWDVDIRKNDHNTADNKVYDVPSIVSAIVDNVLPGNIILLHDSNFGNTEDRMFIVRALPLIIDKLREAGYTFVTVDKLENKNPKIFFKQS